MRYSVLQAKIKFEINSTLTCTGVLLYAPNSPTRAWVRRDELTSLPLKSPALLNGIEYRYTNKWHQNAQHLFPVFC